ncbi:MAG: aspartate aminotransferase family protein [Planctomycetaceae bacterium]|nr:aspartate aminotransferase family protein [Planctomycetaceae bacterium]
MTTPIQFQDEDRSNQIRADLSKVEPISLRTFTPSQAVFAKSAGVFHWTPEGRRLYDFSSGVLVANLGHNPKRWTNNFTEYLGWRPEHFTGNPQEGDYFEAVTMTAYNGITEIENEASQRLLKSAKSCPGGEKFDTVMWAASGSEAVIKSLWACLHRDHDREIILATRFGFHGKKGLAGAVTGSESDPSRDPRVKFIGFPRDEYDDYSLYGKEIDLTPYRDELEALWKEHGQNITCLITEPYLGGGGSFHPPAAYLQMLQQFCNEHDILFILDEVQANFGRTGRMYAFEAYGLSPDFVVLGKGLGNGVPVAAVVGRGDIINQMGYGATSDTWSANPLSCAAVLATLDEFEQTEVLEHTRSLTPLFLDKLNDLKSTGAIVKVRGEGMVFGIECAAMENLSAHEVANAIVEACYLGEAEGDGIHLLGALAGKVLRISPPLTITREQAEESLELLKRLVEKVAIKTSATL